jgi:hypothetical protein
MRLFETFIAAKHLLATAPILLLARIHPTINFGTEKFSVLGESNAAIDRALTYRGAVAA